MEKKCIYCMKEEWKTIFQWREHVVSKMLWTFNDIDRLPEELVCKECNSLFSNTLENNFKETSYEWYFSYMMDLKNKWKIEINIDYLEMKNDFWFENDFFNKTFPILNEKWQIMFVPQIIIKKWNKLYIFLYDTLKSTYDNKNVSNNQLAKFDRIQNIIKSVPNTDISVFWDQTTHDLWIELLTHYKDDFKVTKSEETSTDHLKKEWAQVRQRWKIKIKEENLRLIIKIMFNYFAYCVNKDNKTELLYLDNFNRIRDLVLWKENIIMWTDIEIIKDRVLKEEQNKEKFYIWHQILFELEWDNIIWKITLFWITFYKINIWPKSAIVTDENKFGCWHYFNIPNETLHSLCKNTELEWSDETELWFWLYRNGF